MKQDIFFLRSLLVFLFLLTHQFSYAQNYSLSFDGTKDRVTVPHNTSYNLGTGDFTLEAIVNFNPVLFFMEPIISKRTTISDGFVFMMYNLGTNLLLQTGGVGNEVSANFPSILDGNCHHVAVVRTGSNTTSFYVDGVQRGQNIQTHLGINSPGPIYFGYDYIDDNYIDGSISEIRFWNKGRTQTEIQTYLNSPVPNNSPGLIGLWRFNERDGQIVADSSVTKNDGYLGNSIAVDIQDPARGALCVNGDAIDLVTGVLSIDQTLSSFVSPNPFVDQTTLTLNKKLSIGSSVRLYSVQGALVFSQFIDSKITELKFGQNLSKGIYILQVIDGDHVEAIKLIKD